jgi:hypothetical protein
MGFRWLTMMFGLLLVTGATGDSEYRVEKFEESPGLYYVEKETVN